MADDDDRYQRVNLRIPRDLHQRVMASAAEKYRSMNADIVARLEQTFSPAREGVPITRDQMLQFAGILSRLANVLAHMEEAERGKYKPLTEALLCTGRALLLPDGKEKP
jgi:Arc-like DNA binding domain